MINPQKAIDRKKKGVRQNGQTPNIIGICSYCVLDRPVFGWNQILLHPELTPWWSFLFDDGAHHKKPHSPTHPRLPGQEFPTRHKIDDFVQKCAMELGPFRIKPRFQPENFYLGHLGPPHNP